MVEISRNGFVEPKIAEKPVADEVIKIRNLADKFIENIGYLPEDFFAYVLTPLHDSSLATSQNEEVGEEVFRLSENIPQKERKNMAVYPAEQGNIIILNRGWHASLEDWRNNWIKREKKSISKLTH